MAACTLVNCGKSNCQDQGSGILRTKEISEAAWSEAESLEAPRSVTGASLKAKYSESDVHKK